MNVLLLYEKVRYINVNTHIHIYILAFPKGNAIFLRFLIQWWFHAVNVIGNVALIALDETGLVVTIATSFAHRTVKTSPSFLQNDFGDFDVGTEWMVALEMAERE